MPTGWDLKAELCLAYRWVLALAGSWLLLLVQVFMYNSCEIVPELHICVCSGEVMAGVAHGHGRALFDYADDKSTAENTSLLVEYTGNWRFGCRHGYGECNYVSGEAEAQAGGDSVSAVASGGGDAAATIMRFCGQFEGGLRQGQGVLTQKLVVRGDPAVFAADASGEAGVGGGVWSNVAHPAAGDVPMGPGVAVEGQAEGEEEVREVFYQGEWRDNNKLAAGRPVGRSLPRVLRGGPQALRGRVFALHRGPSVGVGPAAAAASTSAARHCRQLRPREPSWGQCARSLGEGRLCGLSPAVPSQNQVQ